MDLKIIYIDTETGGPDPNNCGLLQLSFAIEINWQVVAKFNQYIRPYPNDPPISQEATDKHGITNEIIGSKPDVFLEPSKVFTMVKEELSKYVDPFNKQDKFFMIGYNVLTFDDPVLRRFFKNNNDKYYGSWFWWPPTDMMAICADSMMNRRANIPNFQLETVAKQMGVTVDPSKLHNAMYDVQLTRELFIRHTRNKRFVYDVYKHYKDQYLEKFKQ